MTAGKRKPLFDLLRDGMEECCAHERGERTLRASVAPAAPPEIDAPTLAALRGQAKLSQPVFAMLLNVSTKTLQSWEQGTRRPSEAARRLLQVFSEAPEVVCASAGMPAIVLRGISTRKVGKSMRMVVKGARKARRAPGA